MNDFKESHEKVLEASRKLNKALERLSDALDVAIERKEALAKAQKKAVNILKDNQVI